ncbi:MAG: Fe-S cluster assembly protein SufD [Deltaproteobacteria bacterium]|nr:Fe-S cluster assembly protein SufD [Deltaproteobacteria bacterium]
MTENTPNALLQSLPESFEKGPKWLRELRSRAAEGLRAQGLPTTRTEAWRFTPVRPLVEVGLSPAAGDGLSVPSAVPKGVTVRSLREVLAREPGLLEGRLDLAGTPEHFAALNTALFEDGLWVDVAERTVVGAPVEIRHAVGRAGVSYPRVLVTVGDNAEVAFIETYQGRAAGGLTNSVVEVDVGRNAKVSHVRIHENAGLQVGRVDVRQAADSRYRSTVVTLGGALLRLDVRALLEGAGAECQLDGAYLVEGRDHVDHHTLVEHRAPHCRSDQTYRGIASGHGTAVFDGIVIVHRGAQKTEAHQENRNLLLSDAATIHTKPHLEIDADDVICSHGATIGSIDEDQLFYLRARGIPQDLAHAMLTYAFLESIIDRVSHEPTRTRMREALLARIPHGEAIREVT